jgi:hypothetical protein
MSTATIRVLADYRRLETSLGPREKNRAAPSAIFFGKPKAILRHNEGEGRFLSAAACLLLGGNSELSALREFFVV